MVYVLLYMKLLIHSQLENMSPKSHFANLLCTLRTQFYYFLLWPIGWIIYALLITAVTSKVRQSIAAMQETNRKH